MKHTTEKEAKDIFKHALNCSQIFTKYPEKLSVDGIAETIIFCVCCALSKVNDKTIIETVLIMLIRFIAYDKQSTRSIDEVAAHITMRTKDYPEMINEIVSDLENCDMRPLYCALYLYPFTDVHYAIVNPKDTEKFRFTIYLCFTKIFKL